MISKSLAIEWSERLLALDSISIFDANLRPTVLISIDKNLADEDLSALSATLALLDSIIEQDAAFEYCLLIRVDLRHNRGNDQSEYNDAECEGHRAPGYLTRVVR